jgi:V/A-type H+-transporting ATPase subunit D
MELLKLRRRHSIAVRGHRLLKDKQDELMRYFLQAIEKQRGMRARVEEKLKEAWLTYLSAWLTYRPSDVTRVLESKLVTSDVSIEVVPRVNLHVPHYHVSFEGDVFGFGYRGGGLLDRALKEYEGVLKDIIRLAGQEKELEVMAREIESTRRRVNALEHILIPNIEETMRYIEERLEEIDRESIVRLMRIKEIVRAR